MSEKPIDVELVLFPSCALIGNGSMRRVMVGNMGRHKKEYTLDVCISKDA